MNPLFLLKKYYPPDGATYHILLDHSKRVAAKARTIARIQGADADFVHEAALLHDIGILHAAAPELGCHGDLPYLCHGIKGRELLEFEGLPRHALVCERHIGVGLTAEEIKAQQLPLPHRDMLPISNEEQIVAYADLFFSKNPAQHGRERGPDQVRASLARFGADKVIIFNRWHARFAL